MSLLGNLEDLGLGDILQIVSLSKKSGVLLLSTKSNNGRILFREGKVIAATVSTIIADISSLLLKNGTVDAGALDTARQVWNELNQSKPLRQLLQQSHVASSALIDDAIREHIQNVVVELFSWTDGEFNFELQDINDEIRTMEPLQREMILAEGVSPQFLAMEALRILDERGVSSPAAEALYPPVVAPPPKSPELGRVIPLKRAAPVSAPPAAAPLPSAASAPAAKSLPPAAQAPSPAPASTKLLNTPVILVDDDKVTLNVTAAALKLFSLQTHIADTVEGAKTLINELEGRGHRYVVVADLLMPRSDGAGILGGIEVLEYVRQISPDRPVAIVSDYDNESAEKKAVEIGANRFLKKPRKGDLDRGVQSEQLGKYMQQLVPFLGEWIERTTGEKLPVLSASAGPAGPSQSRPPAPASSAAFRSHPSAPPLQEPAPVPADPKPAVSGTRDIGGEIAQEIGAEFKPASKVQASAGLSMLRQMSQELNNPESNIEITLLVLRFAAELMSRAVIFLVTDKEIRGLGQFGLEIPGANPTRVVRTTLLPLREDSVLATVAQTKNTHKGPLEPGSWNDYLVKQLGGFPVPEAFVAPIVSRNRCVALLYGDNARESSPIGDTEALEIFLVQAGMAMDRAILERRLGELGRALPQEKT